MMSLPARNARSKGRLTEIFVRQNGRWVHPGWHLDLTAEPEPDRR
jgi:hypothetical protein